MTRPFKWRRISQMPAVLKFVPTDPPKIMAKIFSNWKNLKRSGSRTCRGWNRLNVPNKWKYRA